MNVSKNTSSWKTKAKDSRRKFEVLTEKADSLTEAARIDLGSRLADLNTIVSALERDVEELGNVAGADQRTVEQLHEELAKRLEDLHFEIEALQTGNPTTVSAAVDAVIRAGSR